MRTLKLFALLLVVMLVATACAAPALPAPDAAPADATEAPAEEGAGDDASAQPEVTDIALGFGVDAVFAPHIVAIQKGWFDEAGFTSVETPSFTAGALAGEALAAGEIQLWTPGNVPPISMVHNGMPILITGVNTPAYIEKLVVRNDAGLEQPEDLYDIRIGLLEGSTASAVLANIAEDYGLDVNQMQVVNLPPPEQLTSLINNDVQAMIVWNPWPYQALATEGLDVSVMHNGTVASFPWDEGTESQTSNTLSVWVMGEEFVRENPIAAQAIMDVMLRAQEYVRDPANREEVVQMVAEWNDQPLELLEAMWEEYPFTPNIDATYVADMQTYTDFLAEAGRIGDPMDPLDYTYTGFLENYNPDYAGVTGAWQP